MSTLSLLHGCQTLQVCDVVCRTAAEKGAEEEAERQLVVVKKLKAEVTRKESMLKATQSELDKVAPSPSSPWADVIISCCCRPCLLV